MDNSVIKRDSGMVNDLTTAFQEYAKSLGRMDLYNYYFTFRRNDVNDLTKVEFGKIMDDYQIPSTQRYGRRGNLVVIDHQESGSIRKTILIFARSKNRKYDVVVAEGKMSTNLDWERYCASLLFWHVRLPLFIVISVCNKIQKGLTFTRRLSFSFILFLIIYLVFSSQDWMDCIYVSCHKWGSLLCD